VYIILKSSQHCPDPVPGFYESYFKEKEGKEKEKKKGNEE